VRFLEQRPPGGGLPARRRSIVGNPEQVKAGIEEAAAEYGAEEVIVVTITYDHEARRRSYELIAEQFGLSGAQPASTAATAGDR
jgi:alkanesulfonate monooxygenase SsuD/methylene tetrahydromethanopterin reductase-like flavin-dependent oxidoreductase (luciferase family)